MLFFYIFISSSFFIFLVIVFFRFIYDKKIYILGLQFLCQVLIFRNICDNMRFFIGLLLLMGMPFVTCAQAMEMKENQRPTSTVKNAILSKNVEKGGLFLEVKSYFDEYSSSKPGSITQFYWLAQLPNEEIEVRYVYVNELIDFRVSTVLTYKLSEKQTVELNADRRVPLVVSFKLHMEGELLKIELM